MIMGRVISYLNSREIIFEDVVDISPDKLKEWPRLKPYIASNYPRPSHYEEEMKSRDYDSNSTNSQ